MQPDNVNQPANSPQVLGPASGSPITGSGKTGGKRLPFIAIGALVIIFILLIVGAVLLGGGGKKPNTEHPETTDVDPEGPQAATSLDVEQANNSITQDITSLNDDDELPANTLDDKSLNL